MRKTALLCILALLSSVLSQAENSGHIHGQVTKAGKPLGGVDVILVELSLTTITNKDGIYFFSRIVPGKYTLVFTQGDNSVTREGVIVTSSKTTKKDVDVEWEPLLTAHCSKRKIKNPPRRAPRSTINHHVITANGDRGVRRDMFRLLLASGKAMGIMPPKPIKVVINTWGKRFNSKSPKLLLLTVVRNAP